LSSPIVLSKIPGFDPQKVPVLGVDDHLRPLTREEYSAQSIFERFQADSERPPYSPLLAPFGAQAQAPKKEASVLVGLVQRQEVTLLLTQRAAHLKTHSGQVAFPGGKIDPEDASAEAAALREAHEEVGLEAQHVRVLGRLRPLETGTAFRITPVVALVDAHHVIDFNTHEVAQVFEVPMSYLMNPANHRKHRLELHGQTREWYSMPYHDGEKEHFIWGATAAMIRNFYGFLST